MIRVKFAIFFALIFYGINIQVYSQNAQGLCYTDYKYPDQLANYPSNTFLTATTVQTVRIFVHVVRTSSGTRGLTNTEVLTGLNILSGDYSPLKICFSLLGMDYIDNSSYIDASVFGDNTLHSTLISTNAHANAIDIYMLPKDNTVSAGQATSIPGSSIVIAGSYYNTNTLVTSYLPFSHILSHEMGHCLGLFHTFHGTCACEQDASTCSELVNESNGTTCGDFVNDSYADPVQLFNTYTDANCNLRNMNLTDANGQVYHPNTHNYMSYAPPDCMSLFTAGQTSRILNTINSSTILQPRLVPAIVYVQNRTFSSGVNLFAASQSVIAGSNVTSTPTGPVLNNLTSSLEFRAPESIDLEPGFEATPTGTGEFFTTITAVCSVVSQNNSSLIASDPLQKLLNSVPNFKLAPNPSSSYTNLSFYLSKAQNVSIRIFAVDGRPVRTLLDNTVLASGNQLFRIPLTGLSTGVYIIQITMSNGTSQLKLLKM